MAKQHDIILVAGKGHETYQEIQGVRNDFDDRKTIQELLIALNK
jgi:UDP-N-acetylmuramoyl-L-alanyl-D-glutamate--2,6-diaminopimelate ligase